MDNWDEDCRDQPAAVYTDPTNKDKDKGRNNGQPGHSTNSTDRRSPRQVHNMKVISIPSKTVGHIIGKKGVMIKSLQSQSQACIKIGDSSGKDTNVTLIGTDSAISRVETMINDLLKRYNKQQQPPSPSSLSSSP